MSSNTHGTWNPVWDAAQGTWVEPEAELRLDPATGMWVTTRTAVPLPPPPAPPTGPAPKPPRAAGGREGIVKFVAAVVIVGGLIMGRSVVSSGVEWVTDHIESNGAEDMVAGDCFSPSVSEMITASFDRIDCADAEPFWDMRVVWAQRASSLDEVWSVASGCSGIPYTPDDQETFDSTDGVVICAEAVTP